MSQQYFHRRPGVPGAVDGVVAALSLVFLVTASAQELSSEEEAARASEAVLPTVVVQASPMSNAQPTQHDPTRAISTVGADALDRRQADSIFQLMDDVPGVSFTGGPRSSGMVFNIRGYADNEDVSVKVDGIAKGFEKYRFGGTFIEPDLLKSIEVRRGASIESAGALGGTVHATTKDGADLLRPGQTLGGRVRLGHASNNHELSRFLALYGLAGERGDWLLAHTARDGTDIKLPDGSRLPYSESDSRSHLIKARWFPHDEWEMTASWARFADQGLQPYDTTAGAPGLFGLVLRAIEDDTLSLRTQWTDEAAGHEWKLTVGQSRTHVHDLIPQWGGSTFAMLGDVEDDLDFTHTVADSSAVLRLHEGPASQFDLRLGLQWGRQERTVTRYHTGRPNQPGGFNPAQPPGRKTTLGAHVQADWRWGRWQVLPGLRWDEARVQAQGQTVQQLLASQQATRVRHERLSPSLYLAFDLQPQRWKAFAQVAHGFRPPLIDEVFMQGPYGRCNNGILLGGSNRVAGYAPGAVVAPASGICGDLYRPETSTSVEWGLSTSQSQFLGALWNIPHRVDAKVNWFRNHTGHQLESILARPGGSGVIEQAGSERRHGVELEAALSVGPAFSSLSASRIRGERIYRAEHHPLITAPADRVHWSVGWRWQTVEALVRWQKVSDRQTVVGALNGRDVIGTHEGHALLGMSLRWNLNPHLSLNLTGENLENARYHLTDSLGGGLGTLAAGRNVRLSLSAIY